MKFTVSKCANCKNPKKWDLQEFNSADTDVQRVRIMLCDDCYFSSGPISQWFPLKSQVSNYLKGKEQ